MLLSDSFLFAHGGAARRAVPAEALATAPPRNVVSRLLGERDHRVGLATKRSTSSAGGVPATATGDAKVTDFGFLVPPPATGSGEVADEAFDELAKVTARDRDAEATERRRFGDRSRAKVARRRGEGRGSPGERVGARRQGAQGDDTQASKPGSSSTKI